MNKIEKMIKYYEKTIKMLKRYNLNEFLKFLHKTSKEILLKDNIVLENNLRIFCSYDNNGKIHCSYLPPWDINELVCLAVNVVTEKNKTVDYSNYKIHDLISTFVKERELKNIIESKLNVSDNAINYLIGMGSDQIRYSWDNYKINKRREKFIFNKCIDYKLRDIINIEELVQEVFDIKIQENEFEKNLFCLFLQTFNNEFSQYSFKGAGKFDKKVVDRIRQSLSIKKDLIQNEFDLIKKPIIILENEYICPSMFNFTFLYGNYYYWLYCNYYLSQKNDSKKSLFKNAFGYAFEDYILHLIRIYEINGFKIEENMKSKIADFLLVFDDVKIVIEAKSGLLMLDAISQAPNVDSVQRFINNTILEAFNQLKSSEIKQSQTNEKELYFILIYDNNIPIHLIKALTEQLRNEDRYFIINISQFERILQLYKYNSNKKKFYRFINSLFNVEYVNSQQYDIDRILNDQKWNYINKLDILDKKAKN